MPYNKNPVVIIGAGFCGVIALKTCKENGLQAICFEKCDNIGGLWRFRETDFSGVASVARTTIINTSKEISALSDFPPPAESPNYMHNTCMIQYLEKYAERFAVLEDIHFGREVIGVRKADDFEDTGEWIVLTKICSGNVVTGEDVQRASAVFVCVGHHIHPSMPTFQGQSEFGGKIMHTHSYKDSAGLEKKQVLVVGIGNSGVDAAVEVSHTASKVYLSTRRGAWIIQRLGPNGIPSDFAITRYMSMIYKLFPKYSVHCSEKQINAVFDHDLYNLKPKHHYDMQHPTISDMLPVRIMGGAVIIKGDVHHFTKNGVVFKGEDNQEYKLDAVIFATGYHIQYPFLDDGILKQNGNRVELYRRIIPPKIAAVHPTLAFIGLIQPIGPIFPVAEIQCRWMSQLLNGKITLPPEEYMSKEIMEFDKSIQARYINSQRHTFEVDFVPYMDSLANDIGCKPNLTKLFFTDIQLFHSIFFGPAVPYQYRLLGPHAWDGARNAILTVKDRMQAAFNTRVPLKDKASSKSKSCSRWTTCVISILLPCLISAGACYALNINPQLAFN